MKPGVTVLLLFLMVSASSLGQVVINEALYDSPGNDVGCFVELMGESGMSLDDYSLVGINGDGGREYNFIDLSGHRIPWDGYFVIAQDEGVSNADLVDGKANFQNGPDNIELWHKDVKVDSVGYGDFSKAVFTGEGEPTFDLVGYSIGRRPDGADTNDNSMDFVGLPRTSSGAPNGPVAAAVRSGKLTSTWGKIKHDRKK